MSSGIRDEIDRARNAVFQQFKIRNRSEKEVRDKLSRKKFEPQTIEQTVEYFKDIDLINDRRFAKEWIQSRLKKPFGPKRIRLELKEKGIRGEVIEEELTEVSALYSQEEIVLTLARRRWERYRGLTGLERAKAKKRVFDYLARRGFGLDSINKVIKKLC